MGTTLQPQGEKYYEGQELMSVRDAACIALNAINNPGVWDSLIVNLREPHTYRAFTFYGDQRICLHRFAPCTGDNAFEHPHPWPSRVLVLQGTYDMTVGYSHGTDQPPNSVLETRLAAGSSYSIESPYTWHSVIPRTMCYSLMVNHQPWLAPHDRAPTTKGKDLDKFSDLDLRIHLTNFKTLLSAYLKQTLTIREQT